MTYFEVILWRCLEKHRGLMNDLFPNRFPKYPIGQKNKVLPKTSLIGLVWSWCVRTLKWADQCLERVFSDSSGSQTINEWLLIEIIVDFRTPIENSVWSNGRSIWMNNASSVWFRVQHCQNKSPACHQNKYPSSEKILTEANHKKMPSIGKVDIGWTTYLNINYHYL